MIRLTKRWRGRLIRLVTAVAFAAPVLTGAGASAQIIEAEAPPSPAAPRYGEGIATRYRVGAEIKAKGGTVRDIRLMVAVPLECPEQQVQVLEEDYSPHIETVDFRNLPLEKNAPPGARQMLIISPQLPPRQQAHAVVTYEVITKAVLPPEDPSRLKIPAKPERWLKPYLSGSPYINVDHRKIREAVRAALAGPGSDAAKQTASAAAVGAAAKATHDDAAEASPYEVVDTASTAASDKTADDAPPVKQPADEPAGAKTMPEEPLSAEASAPLQGAAESAGPSGASLADTDVRTDWAKVEAIYEYVQQRVTYEEGAQDKAALQALQEGKADCHGIAALFVAMCRTAKVPARMVWVDGHQYAEFYLEEAPGQGYWFPVQSAGTRAFGSMPSPKVILQKGDNFRVPERRRERLRYASDYTLLLSEPRFKPTVKYIREQL